MLHINAASISNFPFQRHMGMYSRLLLKIFLSLFWKSLSSVGHFLYFRANSNNKGQRQDMYVNTFLLAISNSILIQISTLLNIFTQAQYNLQANFTPSKQHCEAPFLCFHTFWCFHALDVHWHASEWYATIISASRKPHLEHSLLLHLSSNCSMFLFYVLCKNASVWTIWDQAFLGGFNIL